MGVFERREDAERTVDELRLAGFADDQIGFIQRGSEPVEESAAMDRAEARIGASATAGAVVGGVLGAALSMIPGLGWVYAAGVVGSAIGGVVAGTGLGGIVGALVGLGVSEDEARLYETEFEAGRSLVTVRCDGRIADAWGIIRHNGASQVANPGTPA